MSDRFSCPYGDPDHAVDTLKKEVTRTYRCMDADEREKERLIRHIVALRGTFNDADSARIEALIVLEQVHVAWREDRIDGLPDNLATKIEGVLKANNCLPPWNEKWGVRDPAGDCLEWKTKNRGDGPVMAATPQP